MITSVLVAESLRMGAVLEDDLLRIIRVSRVAVAGPGARQQWTLLDFTAEESQALILGERLAADLAPVGGWHVAYRTSTEEFVVFPGKVFHHPRGESLGRHRAQRHAHLIGTPDDQIGWWGPWSASSMASAGFAARALVRSGAGIVMVNGGGGADSASALLSVPVAGR